MALGGGGGHKTMIPPITEDLPNSTFHSKVYRLLLQFTKTNHNECLQVSALGATGGNGRTLLDHNAP